MSDYTPKKGYKVYMIASKSEIGSTVYTLENTYPHTEPFSTYDEAENWINVQGDRHVTYTIMEVFKKP